jgi:3-oxoacyl-[acyl-carrier protein] reductase
MTHEQFVAHFLDATKTGRLNTPEEVASVAVLLAGPAGGGITGALWSIDGGNVPLVTAAEGENLVANLS